MRNKLKPLREAIAETVKDGCSVVLGAGLEACIPFAASHEIIRLRRRDLNIIAPISDMSTDLLIGAGCVAEITGAWVGNVSGGLAHNYRRALEKGVPHLHKVRDHSNFSLGMALMAGAYGLPYVPIRTLLGSDILRSNPAFRVAEDPFHCYSGPLVQVPPLNPDVAVLSVQRADLMGNCHFWGNLGVIQEAALASRKVVAIADEIVPPEIIASDPNRVLFPGYRVHAVCHVPASTHPSPMTGKWKRDNAFFNEYHRISRERKGFLQWLDEWVLDVPDHEAYCVKLGPGLDRLRIRDYKLSASVNYSAE